MSGASANYRRSPDCEMIRLAADGRSYYKEVHMSGECQKCNEHCLDCKCGVQNLGCDPKGTKLESYGKLPSFIAIPEPKEKIDHPSHYQGNKYEVIDIIEDFKLDFHLGNAIKYILRAGKKDNKLDDLNKAIWYLERVCQNIAKEMLFDER